MSSTGGTGGTGSTGSPGGPGGTGGDDEAWRAIVENYGERPALDLPEVAPGPGREPGREPGPEEEQSTREDPDDALARALGEQERYVPPPPPPVPVPGPRRAVAWGGVFGAPLLLLLLLVTRLTVPSWAAYLLVAWFVGGFLYLVSQLPRGPQDPFDDGARI